MKTFLIVLITLYVIYYGGNIFYDIFLKKEKKTEDKDNREEFSMEGINNTGTINVDIDQVEEITTSSKMEVDENDFFSSEDSEEIPETESDSQTGLEEMKRKFEEEKQLDEEDIQIKEKESDSETKTDADKENVGGEKNKIEDEIRKNKEELIKKNKKDFSSLLSMAETKVQVVKVNGEKTYKVI
ncbi:hypothetical protein CAPN002_25930 [Capnocytophaga stomatis]|uniref:hypothetical protein n=1 Tax=Capnocytophaga stomatis TaxID=1848904 RepID=UPI00194F1EE5|nr:hypothetical protein [Capnocytophaga stomatis]GIJ95375.1 hypothetical protein CAPN002_25930 [Capnocytophaga stomatis]